MRTTTLKNAVILAAALMLAGPALAGGHATMSLAEITMNLNHMPSDADKEKLAAIAGSEDSSAAEAAVASAIANLQHRLTDADKEALGAIAADESASAELREIVNVLLNLNHRPSEDEKVALAKIAAGS